MTMRNKDFVAFILTHGRPDNVKTYAKLRERGYTGPIRLIVDDMDKTVEAYREKYGDEVIVFDKKASAATFDQGDNFNDMRAIIYARNACFDIAEKLGFTYFIELDDDYVDFEFRYRSDLSYTQGYNHIYDMDTVLDILLDFYKSVPRCATIAFAQGGDFIGGKHSKWAKVLTLKRKAMNSFICSTERRFKFVGRINEDVNTYTRLQSTGLLMFTTNHVMLDQTITQSNKGGMTDLYLDSGTYVKSFYSVMYHPSSVRVKLMQSANKRLHHEVKWRNTAPKILSPEVKK